VRSLPSECVTNVVRFCPRERCRDGARLTIEETIEFEALDALPPFDDSGNIAWVFEEGIVTHLDVLAYQISFKGWTFRMGNPDRTASAGRRSPLGQLSGRRDDADRSLIVDLEAVQALSCECYETLREQTSVS
jgi:hypothetical protein